LVAAGLWAAGGHLAGHGGGLKWQVWLRVSDDCVHLDLAGRLTVDTVAAIETVVDRDVRDAAGRRVRVGLAGVERVDEAGVQMLRRCRARAAMRGVDLQVRELSIPVREALRGLTSPG
jgi:anti-anti-sigma regulatory factor